MNSCPFCNFESESPAMVPPPAPAHRITIFRKIRRGAEWIFPAVLFVLIPKCPMCVAAYVALFTGIEISFAAAYWLHISLYCLFFLSLGYLALKIFLKLKRNYYVHRTRHAR